MKRDGKVILLPVEPMTTDDPSPAVFGMIFGSGLALGLLIGFIVAWMLGGDL